MTTPLDKEGEGKCDGDLLDKDGYMMDRHPDIKNPLKDNTWDCKNNYDVYTTDYDPEHNHFDRISSDIMDVNKVINKMANLENIKSAPWTYTADGNLSDTTVTNTAVLNNMKDELGVPRSTSAAELKGLNVAEAVSEALSTGGDNRGVNGVGFTKAAGLEGESDERIYGAGYINTGYNNN